MDRTKLNDGMPPSPQGALSDLYRRFKEPFNQLLRTTNQAKDRQECREWYVSMPVIESRLIEAADFGEKSIRCFTGYTGQGKTTVLRYTFNCNDQAVIDEEAGRFVVPISFDAVAVRSDENSKAHFAGCLLAASSTLIDRFGFTYSDEELIQYIERTRRSLLFRHPDARLSTPKLDLLNLARKFDRIGCETMLLKLLLSKTSLRKIVLLLDDIESLAYETQASIVSAACGEVFCLERTTSEYSVNLIISCRHSTRRHFSRDESISVYNFESDISLEDPISLFDLFKARFNSYVKAHSTTKSLEDWNKAKEILEEVAARVTNQYEINLTQLCNLNIRDALGELKEILSNRKWFQRDQPVNSHFAINEYDYAVNEAAVFRALGLRGGTIYPGSNTKFVNILRNTQDERSDLLVCYIIRYLLARRDSTATFDQFKADTEQLFLLFPKEVPWEFVEDAFGFMISAGARLLYEEQVNTSGRHIQLTPRANLIWRLLGSNSLLLEFYRDDMFCDLSHGSADFTQNLSDARKFTEMARVVGGVQNLEWLHFNSVRQAGRENLYKSAFGTNLVSHLLFAGLTKSAKSYFRLGVPEEIQKLLSGLKEQHDRILVELGV